MTHEQIVHWNAKFTELIDLIYRRHQGMNLYEIAYMDDIRYTETPIKRTFAQLAILNRFVDIDKQELVHKNLAVAIIEFGEYQDVNLNELNEQLLERFFEFMTPKVNELKLLLNNS